MVPHIFIHRIARTLEMPIIIDDKNAVPDDSRIEMNELVFGRAIPIRIETQKRNVFWRRIRDGALNHSFNEIQALNGVTGR